MISAHGDINFAVECVKKGAIDYIPKPFFDLNRILIALNNAMVRSSFVAEVKVLKRKITKSKAVEIIGNSVGINQVKSNIQYVAVTDSTKVLITGPNGSGKELVARMIHELSPRSSGPFIEVNCAAIPSELIESTLFGHMKGSFTGAHKDQSGNFEQANGGTLFLDEIGDMSLEAQSKVLLAIQNSRIRRIGGDKDIAIDVRIITATNKNLNKEIARGRFREDLLHRIGVFPIYVPSLNERRDDIPLLANHFMGLICAEMGQSLKGFDVEALFELQKIDYTGNIRQLRNIIERLIIYCRDKSEISGSDVQNFAFSRDQSPLHIYQSLFDRFDDINELYSYIGGEFATYKSKELMFA
jgi:two-component system, NtrC family, nitrogen regulation response regulator NtrX